MKKNVVIEKAVSRIGGQAALAKAIGVTPAMVYQWLTGRRPVPAERCAAIEAATSGAVTRADLRPDLWGDTPKPAKRAA
jgi:DNA-binding transcriptional regulator YdaS (Cro superfamily)